MKKLNENQKGIIRVFIPIIASAIAITMIGPKGSVNIGFALGLLGTIGGIVWGVVFFSSEQKKRRREGKCDLLVCIKNSEKDPSFLEIVNLDTGEGVDPGDLELKKIKCIYFSETDETGGIFVVLELVDENY